MTRINFTILSIVIVIIGLQGCTCHRTNGSHPAEVKTEARNTITIKINRFEQDLFSINVDSIPNNIPKLKNKYGEFFDLFNYKIVNLGSSDDQRYPEALKRFI